MDCFFHPPTTTCLMKKAIHSPDTVTLSGEWIAFFIRHVVVGGWAHT
jgi:hypothetical protein